MKKLLFLPLLILLSACGNSLSDKSLDRKIENLTAFAKVYGHVKYFHPSDEAMEIDWDKFAVHGVETLKNAQNERNLKEKMEVLFSLIAPTVSFYNEKPEGDHFLTEYLEMINTDTTRLKTVAWQHKGVYLGVDNQPYRSSRTYRNDFDLNRAVRISQNLDSNQLKGKEIRLRSSVRSLNHDEDSQAELIIVTDRQNLFSEKFDLSDQRDIRKDLELRVELDENAESIDVGFHFLGTTDLLINSIELEYRSASSDWVPYPLQNPEFIYEAENGPAEWEIASMGVFEYGKPEDGSFRITSKPKLFEHYPSVGETAVRQIISGLWSEVPLALFSNDEFTLPQIGASEIETQVLSQFKHQVDQVYLNPIATNDQDHQLANIIIAWNVFQHFYPYFDVVDVDWDSVLIEALERVLLDHSGDQYSETLHWMIAQLHDGHGAVSCGDDTSLYKPAIRVDIIEDEIVVTSSISLDIAVGEIIKSVGGRPAMEELESKMALISGSQQLREYRALNLFASGENGSRVTFEIEDSAGGLRTIDVLRSEGANLLRSRTEFDYPDILELENEVYLVNLRKINRRSFESRIGDLSSARGIIFDNRNGSNSSLSLWDIVPHLTNEVVESPNWHIPEWIYPDRQNAHFDNSTWTLNPKEPHFKGKHIVLNVPSVVSSGETVMGIIDHYQLATMVGQPTAGTNGNTNYINLPGNCRIMWTGMKVLKHDNSQLHLTGYKPDFPVDRTIDAVRESRDEYLNKAIEIINSGATNKAN